MDERTSGMLIILGPEADTRWIVVRAADSWNVNLDPFPYKQANYKV